MLLSAFPALAARARGALLTGVLPGLLLAAGCAHRASAPVAEGEATTRRTTLRFPLPGLVDVACAEECLALAGGRLYALPAFTPVPATLPARPSGLVREGDAWVVLAPCAPEADLALVADGPAAAEPPPRCAWPLSPGADGALAAGASRPHPTSPLVLVDEPPPIAEAAGAFAGRWNVAIAEQRRLPFLPLLLSPSGAPVVLTRGGGGMGELVRAGSPPRMIRVPVSASPATWPAPLALHPTGREAYLVAWPGASVRAFDPDSLATRWTVGLEGAAQGLFVDPGGRFLLVGEGPGSTDRFVDWPLALPPSDGGDPASDERLRSEPRPPMTSVAVVDLASQTVVARVSGSFRRWIGPRGDPARFVLATDQEVVFLTPPEPPP